MNKIKSTYDKFKTVKFGFSILFVYSSFMKIVCFLDNHHRYRDIQHLSKIYNPLLFYTNRTNKQTHTRTHNNRVLII